MPNEYLQHQLDYDFEPRIEKSVSQEHILAHIQMIQEHVMTCEVKVFEEYRGQCAIDDFKPRHRLTITTAFTNYHFYKPNDLDLVLLETSSQEKVRVGIFAKDCLKLNLYGARLWSENVDKGLSILMNWRSANFSECKTCDIFGIQ